VFAVKEASAPHEVNVRAAAIEIIVKNVIFVCFILSEQSLP
jgi:hypothetical protein